MHRRKFLEQVGVVLSDFKVPKYLSNVDYCHPLEKALFAWPFSSSEPWLPFVKYNNEDGKSVIICVWDVSGIQQFDTMD